MSYWNWVNSIYDYDDAVREYIEARSEASALLGIIKKLDKIDMIYNTDGEWSDEFRKRVERHKELING
jgi:hypothetical protein